MVKIEQMTNENFFVSCWEILKICNVSLIERVWLLTEMEVPDLGIVPRSCSSFGNWRDLQSAKGES